MELMLTDVNQCTLRQRLSCESITRSCLLEVRECFYSHASHPCNSFHYLRRNVSISQSYVKESNGVLNRHPTRACLGKKSLEKRSITPANRRDCN